MSRARVLALWIVFAGFAALITASAFQERLFQEPIWEPAGLTKLIAVAVAYAAWAGLLRLFDARVFVAATASAALVYSCVVAGPLAVIGAAAVLFTGWVIGRSFIEEDALALALGLAAIVFTVSLAVHIRINYWWTYAGFAIAVVAIRQRTAADIVRRIRGAAGALDLRGWPRAAAELLGFILLCHLLATLKPEVSSDGLGMHLVIPFRVAQYHLWDFNFHAALWAVMPMGGDWAFTAAFLLGGELAAKLLNFGVLGILAALVYSLARTYAGRGVSLLATALFLSTPVVQLVTGALFVENVWAAFVAGGVLALARAREDAKQLPVAGVLLGSALAAKFGAITCVLPAIPFAFQRRHGKLPFAVLLLVFMGPPYVSAWVKTGNPVFPFFNAIFKSPYFDSAYSFVDTRYEQPLRPGTLWDVTFHTSRYLESQNGAFGFQYLLLVPLIAIAFARNWPAAARLSAVVAGVSFILTFAGQPYVRYVYPALALASVLSAFVLERLHRDAPRLFAVTAAGLAAVFAVNVYFLPAASWWDRGFFLTPFASAELDRYLMEYAPARAFIDDLNRRAPGEAVAMFGTNQYAGLRATAFTDTWHHKAFRERLLAARDPVECLRLFNRLGIHWFIAPNVNSGLRVRNAAVRRFLILFTRPDRRRGDFYLAHLIKDYRGGAGLARAEAFLFRPPTAKPGIYDDLSEHIAFKGRWDRAKTFPKAYASSVTFSNVAGDTAIFYFEGTSVTYVYTKAFNRGRAYVTVDGKPCSTVDLYSATVKWQASTTCRAGGKAVHELAIRVLGEPSNTTGGFVDVDAFIVH